MEVCTLASGSSGNSLLICCGSTYVLLDAGISARRITSALKALGADPTRLSAVLVTHEHTDHVSGLATLTKQLGVPVYATAPLWTAWSEKSQHWRSWAGRWRPAPASSWGNCGWSPSPPPRRRGQCGLRRHRAAGRGMALATDLGHLDPPGVGCGAGGGPAGV